MKPGEQFELRCYEYLKNFSQLAIAICERNFLLISPKKSIKTNLLWETIHIIFQSETPTTMKCEDYLTQTI